MILPHQLSEEALALLRLFIQSDRRGAGDVLSRDAIERAWKGPSTGIETGLTDLADAGLATPTSDHPPGAMLSPEGEAFFARYHRSCH